MTTTIAGIKCVIAGFRDSAKVKIVVNGDTAFLMTDTALPFTISEFTLRR